MFVLEAVQTNGNIWKMFFIQPIGLVTVVEHN